MKKLALIYLSACVLAITACSQKPEPPTPATNAPAAGAAAQNGAPSSAPNTVNLMPGSADPAQAQASAGAQTQMPPQHPPGTGGMPGTQAIPMGSSAGPTTTAGGQGKITQTMHASSYTYMEVDVSGKKVWVAANAMKVNTGDTIRWRDAAVMKNFTSNALHRTFDEIFFVSYAEIVK